MSFHDRLLREIVDQSTHPLYIVDYEGKFVFANQAFIGLLGYTFDDLRIKSIWEVDQSFKNLVNWHQFIESTKESFKDKELIDHKIQLVDQLGLVHLTQGSYSTISIDEQELIAVSIIDLALREQLSAMRHELQQIQKREMQLIQSLKAERDTRKEDQLDDNPVTDRTAILKTANENLERINSELRQASQAKDDFLASMSHELRTPLNSILGLSEALLECIYGDLNSEQQRAIRHITQNGKHLLSLICDILDLSKIRAGGMSLNYEDVDVESTCAEVTHSFRPEMRRKQLDFHLAIKGAVYTLKTDKRWFKQLLYNLISNAIKFTPYGREIGLTVQGFEKEQRLRVTVWDKGIGIKAEDQGSLFKNFVQLDASLNRSYQGTGLGLAIVSSIMELHGGEVSLDSVIGEGCAFHLDFPWISIPEKIQSDFTPIPLTLERVMIVEDSEVDGNKLRRYLGELGAEVHWNDTGKQVIEEVLSLKPDCIFLDLYLPEQNGWDILQALKTHPVASEVPVIICSVLDLDQDRQDIANFSDYLVKPFSRKALRKAVSSINNQSDTAVVNRTLVVQPPINNAPKILIVDDNQSNIQLVYDYLSRKGFQIVTAENGLDGIHTAQEEQPDLILMDVQMPVMDGLEATRKIRDDLQLQNIPIYALTALAMPGDKERCINAGMDQYFCKPVSLRALYKSIQQTLSPPPTVQ